MSLSVDRVALESMKNLFTLMHPIIRGTESIELVGLKKSTDRIISEVAKIQIYDKVEEVAAIIADARIFCALVTVKNITKLRVVVQRIKQAIKRVMQSQDSRQKRKILADSQVQEVLLRHFPRNSDAELRSSALSKETVPVARAFIQKLMSEDLADTVYAEDEIDYIIENELLIPERFFLLLAIHFPKYSIFTSLDDELRKALRRLTHTQIISFLKGEIPYLLPEKQHVKLMNCIGSIVSGISRKEFTTLSLYLSIFYSPPESLLIDAMMHEKNKEVQEKLSYFLSDESKKIMVKLQALVESKMEYDCFDNAKKLVCSHARGFELLKQYLLSVLSKQQGRCAISLALKLFSTRAFSEDRIVGVIRPIPTAEELVNLLKTIYRNIAEQSLPMARDLLQELYLLVKANSVDSVTLMDLVVICICTVASVTSYKEPKKAIEFASAYPEYRERILVEVFQTLGHRDPDLGVTSLSLVEELYHDVVTEELAIACMGQNLKKAIEITLYIKNEKKKNKLLINLFISSSISFIEFQKYLLDKYTITTFFQLKCTLTKMLVNYLENEDPEKDKILIANTLELCDGCSDIHERENLIVDLIGIVALKDIDYAIGLIGKKLTLKKMQSHANAKIALVYIHNEPKEAVTYLRAIDDVERKKKVKTKLFSEKFRGSINIDIIQYLLEDDADGFLTKISEENRELLIGILEDLHMYEQAAKFKQKDIL